MQKRLVQLFAVAVTFLGIAGLFVEDGHLFDVMNANILLDILRLGLAGFLIYAGFFSDNARTKRNALILFTVMYLVIGIVGLIDSEAWGLLPTGLTGFDIFFHIAGGVVSGIAVMTISEKRLNSRD